MDLEPEIKTMNEIFMALKDLDENARQRIIDWVIEKLSIDISKHKIVKSEKNQEMVSAQGLGIKSFKSVSHIFAKARPKNDVEKVLIIAAYLQETKVDAELTGREINKKLYVLGHGVRNITSTIGSLINKKPQLMIQTRKEGKTKQAQKKYKVTEEGLAAARKMIDLNDYYQG